MTTAQTPSAKATLPSASTGVLVLRDGLGLSDPLITLLARRRIAVEACENLAAKPNPQAGKVDCLVLSVKAEAAMGGARGLIEAARGIGARRLIIISETGAGFACLPEMGGRIMRVDMAPLAKGADALRDGASLALADLIAAPLCAMAAADPVTGALMDMARRVAGFDVSVFVNGPTGSGKEVLSRFIHANSPRAGGAFVALNCAAIPENMLEAILFGHEKGAFTGAAQANKGLIRAASGGTLMLDEISEMALGLQAKLLRVLQERAVTPLGSQTEEAVDIRVIATSNRDMEAEVAQGRFREDLYYRLNVFPLETPALAARRDDIAPLACAMLARHARGGQTPLLSAEAMDVLIAHDWPGNVRELENVMQRALVLAEGGVIEARHVMLRAGAGMMTAPLAA